MKLWVSGYTNEYRNVLVYPSTLERFDGVVWEYSSSFYPCINYIENPYVDGGIEWFSYFAGFSSEWRLL